jgi:hypothetical protein
MARPCIPPDTRRVARDVTLSPETWDVIDAVCAARGINRSRAVEELLWLALRRARRPGKR